MNNSITLLQKLADEHRLSLDEYRCLIDAYSPETARLAASLADKARREVFGNKVYIRGLIEVSSFCRCDCYYCGIRRSNNNCQRYRLRPEQILDCCREGWQLGFRTFVLQGGEGIFTADEVAGIVSQIKSEYPDCAVTLSLGEYSREDYAKMRASGADRYLLRHETADPEHYKRLHPPTQSYDDRMRCLYDLKSLGYQVGCGFMVGSPYQTSRELARDLEFIADFSPEMCGIGPFIPHRDTPFGDMPSGSAELCLYLLSLLRLIKPTLLLPATTALGTLLPNGRESGMLAGANVIMPNLSPKSERKKYSLYNNKLSDGDEAAENLEHLRRSIAAVGYEIVTDKGDAPV